MWLSLPQDMPFLEILDTLQDFIGVSKENSSVFKVDEMETKRKLDEATRSLHLHIYNRDAQGLVNGLRERMRGINKCNAKGAEVKSQVKWKHVGDKCSRQFSQTVRKKSSISIILSLRNKRGELVNHKTKLEDICFGFYSLLYKTIKSQQKQWQKLLMV